MKGRRRSSSLPIGAKCSPIGCTGARITTTLLHALETRDKKLGLATLCISGGMGLSLLVEKS